MSEALISLANVTRGFGAGAAAFQALRGVDLGIDEGDFVAIMGPSGSGKSSLMNILGCLDTPSGGSYRFRGLEVAGLSRDQRALLRRHALGFVFQGFNLLARTSAQENVELPLLYRGESATLRHERARAALASVGLEGWGVTPRRSYRGASSSGWRLPGHWSPARRSCLPTSPPGISIRNAAGKSWTC